MRNRFGDTVVRHYTYSREKAKITICGSDSLKFESLSIILSRDKEYLVDRIMRQHYGIKNYQHHLFLRKKFFGKSRTETQKIEYCAIAKTNFNPF